MNPLEDIQSFLKSDECKNRNTKISENNKLYIATKVSMQRTARSYLSPMQRMADNQKMKSKELRLSRGLPALRKKPLD